MKKLPIADCRLPIGELLPRRSFARRCHDCNKLVGFLQQGGQLACGHRARFNKQFEPQRGFIRLFLNGSDFGDEFGLAAGAATGAVIRRHRSAAADNLLGDDASGVVIFWNRPCKFDDTQGKGFGSSFEFSWVHGASLQPQSAIGNRQSAIPK